MSFRADCYMIPEDTLRMEQNDDGTLWVRIHHFENDSTIDVALSKSDTDRLIRYLSGGIKVGSLTFDGKPTYMDSRDKQIIENAKRLWEPGSVLGNLARQETLTDLGMFILRCTEAASCSK